MAFWDLGDFALILWIWVFALKYLLGCDHFLKECDPKNHLSGRLQIQSFVCLFLFVNASKTRPILLVHPAENVECNILQKQVSPLD